MFAKYQYKPNSSLTNIYSDIKALLTGTTDKNLLSNSCDKPNSTIVSTVPAGWEETTGSLPTPTEITMPVDGYYNAIPVNNGSYTLWPVQGTNFIVKSVDDGVTWSVITLPITLGNATINTAIINLAWGEGLWVLTNYGTAVSYILTSPDGITWTQVAVGASVPWQTPVYADGKWLILTTSGQATLTSSDGIIWTYNAVGLPSGIGTNVPVFANGRWVVTPTTNKSSFYTSADTITWSTVPVLLSNYLPPKFVNDKWFVLPNGSMNTIYYSMDGIIWADATFPSSYQWSIPIYSNGIYYAGTMGGPLGAYSYDGITWVNQGLSISYASNVLWYEAAQCFMVIGGGNASSPSYISFNGKDWRDIKYGITKYTNYIPTNILQSSNALIPFNTAVELNGMIYLWPTTNTSFYAIISVDGYITRMPKKSGVSIYLTTINNKMYCCSNAGAVGNSVEIVGGYTSCVLRSLYADGVNYKKVSLSVTSGNLAVIPGEDFTTNACKNILWSAGHYGYTQRLARTTTGSYILIFATSSYIILLSNIGGVWGNPPNDVASIFAEYSRDDDWNVGSGANPYPSVVYFAGTDSSGFGDAHSLRVKATRKDDIQLATLTCPAESLAIDKATLVVSGQAVRRAADIMVYSDTIAPYYIQGGKILGNIKSTSYNSSLTKGNIIELTDGLYFVHPYGSVSESFLFPIK